MLLEVQTRLTRCTGYLLELKDLTGAVAPSNQMGLVRRISLKVVAELADLREVLVAFATRNVSHRKSELFCLNHHNMEDHLNVDSSIRFVGLDWDGLMSRWTLTCSTTKEFLTKMEMRSLDLILLASILGELDKLEAEIGLHTEAVMAGRLKEHEPRIMTNKQSSVNKLQDQSIRHKEQDEPIKHKVKDEPIKPSPSQKTAKKRSFRINKASIEKSKSFRELGSQKDKVRYKKSKTTDLSKLSSSIEKTRRKSHITPRPENQYSLQKSASEKNIVIDMDQPQRKTSFIDHVSNLFKGIL